jgi:ABC-type nitrate/sulfonate/bicarbonate transport system substrate-binding protein
VHANSGISTIRDLQGRRIAGSPGSPALQLVPLFARLNTLDFSRNEIVNYAPAPQEPMLVRGRVDAGAVATRTRMRTSTRSTRRRCSAWTRPSTPTSGDSGSSSAGGR